MRHRPAAVVVGRHFFTVFHAAGYGFVDDAFVVNDIAVQKGDIIPSGCFGFYLFCKRKVRRVVFCDDQKSGGVLVQTVDYPRTGNAVDFAQILDPVDQGVD